MEFDFYGNIYQVSEDGVVTSHKGKVLSPNVDLKGYHRVVLQAGRKRRLHTGIHRLVAHCHLPNPDNKPEVNHKDGDKSNNHVSNLEWVTSKENVAHAYETQLRTPIYGPKSPNAKLTPELVAKIHKLLGDGVRQVDIAKEIRVGQAVISQVKRRVRDWY